VWQTLTIGQARACKPLFFRGLRRKSDYAVRMNCAETSEKNRRRKSFREQYFSREFVARRAQIVCGKRGVPPDCKSDVLTQK
jgi:hypothetical protein